MEKENNFVYRYTSVARLLEIITTQRLPLLNPEVSDWKDSIDIGFVKACEKPNKKIGILCFTNEHATSFHWDLFAKNDGVRIKFDKTKLENKIDKLDSFYRNDVSYMGKDDLRNELKKFKNEKLLPIESFAFLKRTQYEAENEWRIVCEKEKDDIVNEHVVSYLPIKLSYIKSITFSPYYKIYNERKFLRNVIRKIWNTHGGNLSKLKIYRSTLFDNKKLKSLLENNDKDEIEES